MRTRESNPFTPKLLVNRSLSPSIPPSKFHVKFLLFGDSEVVECVAHSPIFITNLHQICMWLIGDLAGGAKF